MLKLVLSGSATMETVGASSESFPTLVLVYAGETLAAG